MSTPAPKAPGPPPPCPPLKPYRHPPTDLCILAGRTMMLRARFRQLANCRQLYDDEHRKALQGWQKAVRAENSVRRRITELIQ